MKVVITHEVELTIADRVANGARWLDENFPGWEQRIDVGTLDLSEKDNCICGQVFEREAKVAGIAYGFNYAKQTLFGEANSWISGYFPYDGDDRAEKVSVLLGFDTDLEDRMADNWDDRDRPYRELQEEWLKLLASRR